MRICPENELRINADDVIKRYPARYVKEEHRPGQEISKEIDKTASMILQTVIFVAAI